MLIHWDESKADFTPESVVPWEEYHGTLTLTSARFLVDGSPTQPEATSRTVRCRDDRPVVTAGPYTETKEQPGGYYVMDCKDIDEALAWAAKIPSVVRAGAVEARPLMYPDGD